MLYMCFRISFCESCEFIGWLPPFVKVARLSVPWLKKGKRRAAAFLSRLCQLPQMLGGAFPAGR